MTILFLIIFSALVGYYGERNGRSFALGLILSLILSPLIGFIIMLIIGKPTTPQLEERNL